MKVYATYRNRDTVEGRGGMVIDKVFLHRKHAEDYIDEQPGIMGRKAKWSQEKYGDWTVETLEVLEYDVVEAKKRKENLREEALAKLSAEEKEVLGLEEN